MIAIAEYEEKNNIPFGYINHAIASSSPHGAWSQLERGEIPLDEEFYARFSGDLSNPRAWAGYWRTTKGSRHATTIARTAGIATKPAMPPSIDGKFLFREIMRVSRAPNPYFVSAIRRLRAQHIAGGGQHRAFVIGACTNDAQLPPGHEYASSGGAKGALRELFDVWVSSSEVGMRKPEKGIYELVLKQLAEQRRNWYGGKESEGVEGSQVVFLDDIGMNLKGAAALGIRGIKVTLGETWKAVRELEGVLGLSKGALFDEDSLEKLKREGKWKSKL